MWGDNGLRRPVLPQCYKPRGGSRSALVRLDAHAMARPICTHCSRWIVYQYLVAGKPREGWRCTNGVTGADERSECPCYEREPGADDDLKEHTFTSLGSDFLQ
jgi:hypothetical protein